MARVLLVALSIIVGVAGLHAQPLPTPTDLVAVLVYGGMNTPSVKLTWNAPTGPWSYRVYRSVNDTLDYQSIGMTPHRVFYDHFIALGDTYYYFVRSVSGNLQGERSNITSIAIIPPQPIPHGTISGTVIDDSTTLPIRHARIRFFRIPLAPSFCARFVYTDSLGHYSAQLDTGTYLVKAEASCNSTFPCYVPEYFDNSPTPQGATPVPVTENSVFVADFGLSRAVPPSYAFIDGVVTDTLNVPLPHASVAIIRTLQEMNYLAATTGSTPGIGEEAVDLEGVGHTRGVVWRGYTDSLGRYHARVISSRSYIAMASKHGYIPEYFDNKPDPATADIIFVTGDTSGINFSLAERPVPQNSISGIVKDSLGTRVPSRIVLLPVRPTPTPHHVRFAHTDSLGEYTITNVWEGNYFALALPFSEYAPAFYKEGEYGVRRIQDADTVNIVGNVTGIDIGVVPIVSNGLAQISGRVRAQAGAAIAGVRLTAITPQNQVVGIGITDATGSYSIYAVLPGPISIVADRDGYQATEGNINIGSSTFNVNNVDFVMAPMTPTSVGNGIMPLRFTLEQNYPNPFNPKTSFEFSVPEGGTRSRPPGADGRVPSFELVTLKVYDLLGREVATLTNEVKQPGAYTVQWDASGVASGVYFYRLTAGSFVETRKLLLLR